MNRRTLKRSLLAVGLLALTGAVAAQAYYTHELAQRVLHEQAAIDPAQLAGAGPADVAQASNGPLTPDNWMADPWAQMERDMRVMETRMQQVFDQAFGSGGLMHTGNQPAIGLGPGPDALQIKDEGKAYVVTMPIPGVDRKDIRVQVDDGWLSISAQGQGQQRRTADNGQVISEQVYSNVVERHLPLPGPVQAGKMKSDYDDGVLTVTLPKAVS